MNAEEALQLCRLAKTISPAQAVDEYTPAAWALILEDTRFVDARQALKELGAEQEWIHVSHIVKRVKRIRGKRLGGFGPLPEPPGYVGDEPALYKRWVGETIQKIADGEIVNRDEVTHPAELLSGRPVAALGQVGKPIPADARATYKEERRKSAEVAAAKEAEAERVRAEQRAARAEAKRLDRLAREQSA